MNVYAACTRDIFAEERDVKKVLAFLSSVICVQIVAAKSQMNGFSEKKHYVKASAVEEVEVEDERSEVALGVKRSRDVAREAAEEEEEEKQAMELITTRLIDQTNNLESVVSSYMFL